MIKKLLIIFFLVGIQTSFASSFKGCGEYFFKGVFRQSKKSKEFLYIVHEGTRSQMAFTLPEVRDVDLLRPLLDQPTKFKGNIVSLMDGTKGAVKKLSEIGLRFPNPLDSRDSEISLILKKECEK